MLLAITAYSCTSSTDVTRHNSQIKHSLLPNMYAKLHQDHEGQPLAAIQAAQHSLLNARQHSIDTNARHSATDGSRRATHTPYSSVCKKRAACGCTEAVEGSNNRLSGAPVLSDCTLIRNSNDTSWYTHSLCQPTPASIQRQHSAYSQNGDTCRRHNMESKSAC